jgi:hypothetical protein
MMAIIKNKLTPAIDRTIKMQKLMAKTKNICLIRSGSSKMIENSLAKNRKNRKQPITAKHTGKKLIAPITTAIKMRAAMNHLAIIDSTRL